MGTRQWCQISSASEVEAVSALDRTLSEDPRFYYVQDDTGGFEQALLAGNIWLLKEGDQTTAFIHIEEHVGLNDGSFPKETTVEIAALAVVPKFHGDGRGADLVEQCLQAYDVGDDDKPSPTLWATVSPENFVMLGLLFRYGFFVSRYLEGFNAGEDRVLLQLALPGALPLTETLPSVPVADRGLLQESLDDERVIVTGFAGAEPRGGFAMGRLLVNEVSGLVDETYVRKIKERTTFRQPAPG